MPRVRTRGAQGTSSLALVAGIADVVVGLIDLSGALQRVAGGPEVGAETTNVHLPDVHRRLALQDPLGHDTADSAGARQAVRAEARRHEESAYLALSETELVVGGERLRSVDQAGDRDLLHDRYAPRGVGGDLLEAGPVLFEQAAIEIGRDLVEQV